MTATLTQLLGAGNILSHLDASDTASIFEDSGGADAAEDGDIVLRVNQQPDAALTTPFTSATNGPTYRANYSSTGYPALQFDGTNDFLAMSDAGLVAQRHIVLAVITWISGAGTLWYRGNSFSHLTRLYYNSQSSVIPQTVGGSGGYFGGTFTPGAGALAAKHASVVSMSIGQVAVDAMNLAGAANNTGPISASLATQFVLGAADAAGTKSQFLTFALHEIVYCGASTNWGDAIRAAARLRYKWGITDPSADPVVAAGGVIAPPIGQGGLIYRG